jgi:O-methyltransferase
MKTSMVEAFKRALASKGVVVYRHANAARSEKLNFINRVKAERDLLLTHVEAEQLINALQATHAIEGEIAEVGTFRGASARLLRTYANPSKILHVFDTFEGLPQPGKQDAEFQQGQFAASLGDVQAYLGQDRIRYHQGIFPQSATEEVRRMSFSFVHLDVDLYEGTLDCLRFFYPRMNIGGIILSHDFGADRAPGVIAAFAEFFQPLGVPYIQLSGFQGMAVKLA